jgi:hypothetical protein
MAIRLCRTGVVVKCRIYTYVFYFTIISLANTSLSLLLSHTHTHTHARARARAHTFKHAFSPNEVKCCDSSAKKALLSERRQKDSWRRYVFISTRSKNTVTNFETRNFVAFAYSNTLITLVRVRKEKLVIMHQTLAQATDGRVGVMHGLVSSQQNAPHSHLLLSLSLQNRDAGITHAHCSAQQMLQFPIRYIEPINYSVSQV